MFLENDYRFNTDNECNKIVRRLMPRLANHFFNNALHTGSKIKYDDYASFSSAEQWANAGAGLRITAFESGTGVFHFLL